MRFGELREISRFKKGSLVQFFSKYQYRSVNIAGTEDWVTVENGTLGIVLSQRYDMIEVLLLGKKYTVLVFDDNIREIGEE